MHQYLFVLDNELNLLNTMGIIGGGQLTHPNGIAVDKDRTIALSNYRFHQVKKFLLNDGKCICSIGALGPEDSNFDYTLIDMLLAVMGSFASWIGGNSRIQAFRKLSEFARIGFDWPTHILVDNLDNVYVIIGVFTNLGNFMSIATNKPFAIAITSSGYSYPC